MNTILSSTLKTLALGFMLAASVHSAQATSTPIAHTYVSGLGDDGNPCTRISPCATFQGALANTLPGGVITALDAGDYGKVTINQAVTIDGTGAQASIVTNDSYNAVTINGAATDTIILRQLTFIGLSLANSGILVHTGALVVDGCKISGFINNGLSISGSGNIALQNTSITGCFSGIDYSSTGLMSLRNVSLQGNQIGLNIQGGPVNISHSLITQNSSDGLYAFQSTLSVSDCMIFGNGTAVDADSGSVIRLTNNDIFNNTTGITTNTNGVVSTAGNNRKAGNTTPGAPTAGRIIVTQ